MQMEIAKKLRSMNKSNFFAVEGKKKASANCFAEAFSDLRVNPCANYFSFFGTGHYLSLRIMHFVLTIWHFTKTMLQSSCSDT